MPLMSFTISRSLASPASYHYFCPGLLADPGTNRHRMTWSFQPLRTKLCRPILRVVRSSHTQPVQPEVSFEMLTLHVHTVNARNSMHQIKLLAPKNSAELVVQKPRRRKMIQRMPNNLTFGSQPMVRLDLPGLTSCVAGIGEDFRFTFSREGVFWVGFRLWDLMFHGFQIVEPSHPWLDLKRHRIRSSPRSLGTVGPKYGPY